jgi:hypothetical protein
MSLRTCSWKRASTQGGECRGPGDLAVERQPAATPIRLASAIPTLMNRSGCVSLEALELVGEHQIGGEGNTSGCRLARSTKAAP